ncbi:MAG: MEKHLA domain-containing protein [Cyclobacteriaceae bacterium]
MAVYPWESEAYEKHAKLLCQSFEQCTAKPLIATEPQKEKLVNLLFYAPFALVSHGTQEDPVFNYGNNTALKLFELSWEQFIALPSRKSAEPVNREERQRLLNQVTQQGYIDDYSGVRISSTGKRFLIQQAIVWNLIDKEGKYHGQAAVFDQWTYL